jgi:hypothetical protein
MSGYLIFCAVIGLVLWLLKGAKSAGRGPIRVNDPVGAIDGPGNFEIEVVGESHYQPAPKSICGRRTRDGAQKYVQATLLLEDQNAHDSQAVRIDVEGKTVGYLPRDTARSYRKRIREAGHPRLVGHRRAVIRGVWDRGPADRGYFGIWLDLPPNQHLPGDD